MGVLLTIAAIILVFYFFGFALDVAGGFIHLLLIVVLVLGAVALYKYIKRNR